MKKILIFFIQFIIVIVIALLICYIRNCIVISGMSQKAEKNYSNKNYYIKTMSYEKDLTLIKESYNMEDKYITTLDYFMYSNEFIKKIVYKSGNDNITLIENNVNKVAILKPDVFGDSEIINVFKGKNIFSLGLQNIKTEQCNGKQCYSIKIEDIRYLIDKETGLITRLIKNQEPSSIIDYYYEFNKVKDNNITKPDLNGYKIQ